ncbi:hypothetical protein [Streptomyces sp. NBC_01216]|uniref:hypothetical protein n=1 Tax=unclassified Streptomyces TaxID=2593676 RepID=UPI002E11D6C3|nr:hypothetical protein OG393_10685 [Streptomyces sp. NBC_01216]
MSAALALVLAPPAPSPGDTAPVAPLPPYRTDRAAKPVAGAAAGDRGPLLPGPGTYTDVIAKGEKKFYRVHLDGVSNVFLSAVLAPPPGGTVGVVDGITLSLTTASGIACGGLNDLRFYGESARPIADYVSRRIEAGRDCQQPGDYLFAVEGVGREQDSVTATRMPVELKYVVEPGLRNDATPPPAPTGWSTTAPPLVSGPARQVGGGTGFNDAPLLGDGGWRDTLRPGESRFYRVPLAWGQQLGVTARFANSASPEGTVTADGLRVALYNPARGAVEERKALYTGRPTTVSLLTAPAAYANRTQGSSGAVRAMRFQGAYYLQLTLDRRVPEAVPLELDVSVRGAPQPGPEYAGEADATVFGLATHGTDHRRSMLAVGIGGIGLGTALVLGLVAWSAASRRGMSTRPVSGPGTGPAA